MIERPFVRIETREPIEVLEGVRALLGGDVAGEGSAVRAEIELEARPAGLLGASRVSVAEAHLRDRHEQISLRCFESVACPIG